MCYNKFVILLKGILIMFVDASVQEWTELYDVARITKSLRPWQYVSDDWILALDLPGRKEPCYCIVTGQNSDAIAIAIYPSRTSLAKYSEYLSNKEDKHQVKYEQNYLICYFCDRQEMLPMQLDKLRELGISFRGKNEWIQFVSIRPGYAPYMIDKDEVILLKAFFEQFNEFINDYTKGKINFVYEDGNVVYRNFIESNNVYSYKQQSLDLSPDVNKIKHIHDEDVIDLVKRMPTTDSELELDLVYIDTAIYDENLDRPAIGRIVVLGENSSESILGVKVVLPNKNPAKEIYDLLTQKITEHGRPRVIYCKRDICYDLLLDFCRKTEIKLERISNLVLVDELVKAI